MILFHFINNIPIIYYGSHLVTIVFDRKKISFAKYLYKKFYASGTIDLEIFEFDAALFIFAW